MNVGKLEAELTATDSVFGRTLDRAKVRFDGFAKHVDSTSPSIGIDEKGFGAGLGRMRGMLDKFTAGVGSIALPVLGGAALGVGAAGAFGVSAIQGASSVAEAQNKVNAVFGESAGVVDQFASGAAKSIGMAKGEALAAAGQFGNLFDQLGIGSDKTADMSTKLLGLAADFGSFNDASNAEVLEAMTAGFRGEYDALQRFVPTINAAAVQQKALTQTGKKSADSLTEQEKALATYALMFDGAGKAVGDFADTQDSFANKSKTVGAMWTDFTNNIGAKFLPVAEKTLGFLADKGMPVLENIADAVATGDWSKITSGLGDMWTNVSAWFDANKGQIASTIGGWLKSGVEQGVALGGVVMDKLGELLPQIGNWVTGTAVPYVEQNWGAWWDAFTGWIGPLWEQWQGKLGDLVGKLGGWFIGTFVPWAQTKSAEWGMALLSWLGKSAWNFASEKLEELGAGIVGFVSGLPDRIGSAASTMWDGIKDSFRNALNWIIEKWNSASFTLPSMDTPFGKIGGFSLDTPDLPSFGAGGVVPGSRGTPQLIMAHAGETILPTHKGAGMGSGGGVSTTYGGNTVNLYLTAAPNTVLDRAAVRALGVQVREIIRSNR